MAINDKLKELIEPGKMGSQLKKLNVPEDWRPRLDIDDSKGGFVISSPRAAGNSVDTADILKEFDLNPDSWDVTSLRRSRWQTYNGEWLESVRVNLAPSYISAENALDAEKLVDEIKKWRPTKAPRVISGDGAFLVAPSDQQIGKKANGVGTEQSVERILNLTEASVNRLANYRKMGISIGTICLALPGDHVEGIVSQGGKLQGQAASDLGITEQVRVARRLLMSQIKALAPLADRLIVPVVNGNHDEATRQVVTDPADGWNVEIASSVQDACMENPALSHVEFRFPSSGHQTLAVDINGTMLGLFHGHQASQTNTMKFISNHAAGQTPLGMSDLWISGHYHNFRVMDVGSRLWIQAPTTDPGSEWFRDRMGLESKPGLLTMIVGKDFEPREFISVLAVK